MFAGNNHADYRFAFGLDNLHIFAIERNLHTLIVYFVIHNRGLVDVSASYAARFCLYDKEIFYGLGAVYASCKVGEVVTKFHRLVVHSVCPTSQHGYFGGGACVQCVARIAEMLEGNGHVRLCGIDVLRNSCAQQ